MLMGSIKLWMDLPPNQVREAWTDLTLKFKWLNKIFLIYFFVLHRLISCAWKVSSYRQGGVLIQLVLGTDPKACVVAASRPGQLHCRLQVAVHLLVDGATKLCAVIPATQEQNVKRRLVPMLGKLNLLVLAARQLLTRWCAAGSLRPCNQWQSCSWSVWIWRCRMPAGSRPASPRSPARQQRWWWDPPCRSPGRSPCWQSHACSRSSAWRSSCCEHARN